MAPFGPVAARIHALQEPINQLYYNRRECQQLVDHIKAFIASLEEKSYTQDLLDLQQKLFEALTDLYDVLTDIRRQPQLKQILWRDGITTLVSRVYEVLISEAVAELDLILRKNKEARSIDVDHFHDMIRTAQDDQILKILGVPSSQLSQAIIALHQRIRTIPNHSNPERQFLNRGLCAMQTLKAGFIPPPQDTFSMTEFDVVIYYNRELGKGGYGEVFEGNWHGTKVAIKRIRNFHPAFGANEINIMKRLKHDHVLQTFGANLNSNQLLLVCALKSQGDACTFLHNNPSANRRKLCYDVSLGLVYLHENSVIHGDIKPQNILIDENGIPCLCDFGLSRIRTFFTHAPTIPLDEDGSPIGTLQYMSPEQMVYGTTNEASDVYSFGMTIYEIFSGELPFKDISGWLSLRSKVVRSANRPAKPQPQADNDCGFDDKLWSLIEECWSQEPSNRPTAVTVSLRLGDVKGCPVKSLAAEMYKEIADLTAEMATVKESNKAARQELELAGLRNSSARREQGQAGLKKGLDEERDLRKRLPVDKNSDELRAQFLQSLSEEEQLTGHQDDVMIAVMGVTGAGKSSFIKLLTGDTSIKIGDDLDSETSDVQIIHFRDPDSGRKVTFVDTPGFDNTRGSDDLPGLDDLPKFSDTDILIMLANFLLREYDQNRKLSGLIYVQRISDPRLSGQFSRNLRMFRDLCGPAAYKNVVILTTYWDQVPTQEVGVNRESQLKSKHFANLVEGGAQFMRYDRTVESTHKVLRHILPMPPIITQIQAEMGNGLSLIETVVGSGHNKDIEKALANYKKEIADITAEMATLKESNKAARQELGTELAQLRNSLAGREREQARLKKGLNEERNLRKRPEKNADELRAQFLQSLGKDGHQTGHQDEVVIAVMGVIGAGKSSFIKLLTGDTSVKISDDLDSKTTDVELEILHFRDPDSGRKVTFVDTPGFDNTRGSDDLPGLDDSPKFSDTDILIMIADFLLREYDQKRKLSGLIYVQRISDPRLSGQSSRNLRMFRELCGPTAYKNLVVLTTYWDQVPTHEVGVQREAQLNSKFFAKLVEGGAQFMRHDRTVESARNVLRHILPMPPTTTQIQTEIRQETAAGSVHSKEVEKALANYKMEIADLTAEMATIKESNKAARQELEKELAGLRKSLARQERGEQPELKKGSWRQWIGS